MLRSLAVSCVVLARAACGSKSFPSVCTVQPAPMACSQMCTTGSADTCPAGFYCNANGNCDAQCTQGGSQCGSGYICTADGMCESQSDCTDLSCKVVNCEAMNLPPTTITGTVYAPNGTLELYGINVYVPDTDPGPIPSGLQCDQCTATLAGNPVGEPQITGSNGQFTLTDMPSGKDIPLVISSGKWRRIINIPMVNQCGSNSVDAADTTLPKSMTDLTPNTATTNGVSMPQIAISTGEADALECLILKLGIAPSEPG
jgi:hypothetical protein